MDKQRGPTFLCLFCDRYSSPFTKVSFYFFILYNTLMLIKKKKTNRRSNVNQEKQYIYKRQKKCKRPLWNDLKVIDIYKEEEEASITWANATNKYICKLMNHFLLRKSASLKNKKPSLVYIYIYIDVSQLVNHFRYKASS